MRKTEKTKRAASILELLKKRYPVPETMLTHENPWELMIATILAAQCTDARVNTITPELFRRWPGPAEMAKASLEELESVIRPTGFYHNKAKNILGAARRVTEIFHGKVPQTLEELITIPGVARKTANVVLWGAFGINEGLAVDTHVKRISFRLGLTKNTDPVKIEQDLMKIFPRQEWGDVNHRLVWFGRDVCDARKPACDSCELSELCPRCGVGKKMKKLLLLTLLSMSFVLSACAPKSMRMVDAKDEVAFVTMYHAMKPAMLKNELVDSKGNWYAPLISTGSEHAGLALLDRLSPKFCCAYLGEPPVKSFRSMTTPEDDVRVGPWSASLRTQDYAVKLQLAAVTDWNDDGKDDWLVSCRVMLAASPDESREYFLLIANLESSALESFVLMERRHMFRRVSVLSDNSLSRFAGTVTVEVEQGQIDVTQAPGRTCHKFDDSNLKSSTLSH